MTCKEPNNGQSDALGQNTGPKLTLVELDNCYVEIESQHLGIRECESQRRRAIIVQYIP